MRRGVAALALVLAAAELRAQRTVPFNEAEWAQNIRVLAIEDGRAPTPTELAYLVNTALGRDISAPSAVPDHRVFAIRALGRLGRSDVIQPLLALAGGADARVTHEAELALTFALRALVDPADPYDPQRQKPPPLEWHREAHAFVALAARAPDRAATSMTAYVGHQVANVRRYAAGAAGLMKDQAILRRLAVDTDDNVCTAAISELLRLGADDLEPIFLSALGRADYQLLLLVTDALKGVKSDKDTANALADALRRVTADRKETSREVRLALLSRIETHATTMQARVLEPLARDFDPPVAEAAGRVYERLTGRALKIEPQLVPRPLPPTAGELLET